MSNKFFLILNEGIQWTVDFGQDSVIVNVKGLVTSLKISSQTVHFWILKLLLSKKQVL